MAQKILSPLQKKLLDLFSENASLKQNFYLTGGTALAVYYLRHRYSEGLDFFSVNPIDFLEINVFIKNISGRLKIHKTDFQQSYNRNIFFLHTPKKILKLEFTYFPFDQIEKPILKDGVLIDSLTDIAVNNAFTIIQNPRARDFIDLYLILKKRKEFSFPKLIKMARSKFDYQIDPIQLGAQLLKAKDIAGLPRMFIRIKHNQWRNFFLKQIEALSPQIFK